MRVHSRLSGLVLSFAAIGVMSAMSRAQTVSFTLGSVDHARALHVARTLGKVKVPSRGNAVYTITLKKGVTLRAARHELAADRAFSLVWDTNHPLNERQRLHTVSGLAAAFERVKPDRAEGIESMATHKWGNHNENGADYLGGHLFFLQRRAYPYDRMDWSAYGRAIRHMAKMPKFSNGGAAGNRTTKSGGSGQPNLLGGKWTFLGPKNLTFPYQWGFGPGAGSGRVNAAAYDPTSATTLYLGGAEGGLWKSTDGGQTFASLGDTWQFECVSSIAIDPSNHNNIYVGTGDFPGWNSFSNGIEKSTNGGATWTNYGSAQFGNSCISSIIVDPTNPSIVTITTGDGGYQVEADGAVWRSVDGGKTWNTVISTVNSWSSAVISPSDNGTYHYYVAGSLGGTQLIERSDNQGATWTSLAPPTGLSSGAWSLATSPTSPKTVYFFAPNSGAVYKSTDMGGTWTNISGNLGSIGAFGQNDYNYYISVGTVNGADDVFIGQLDIFETTNGGTSWSSVLHTYTGNDLAHTDQHCMTINPKNPNDMLIGNDGGAYRGTRTSGTWNYASLNKTMGVTQFYGAAWDPNNKTDMLGGAQDNGTPAGLGNLNQWGVVLGGDGFYCGINPANSKIQYASVYYDDIYETQDGWNTGNNISPSVGGGEADPFVTYIYQDPVDTKYMFTTTNYLYRWDNSVQSWTNHLGGQALSNGATVHAIAVAPSSGLTIYTGSDDGRIFVSRDGGNTFTNINSSSLPNRAVVAISVDKKNPNAILVGLSGSGTPHLYYCSNTAASNPSYASVSGSGGAALPDISLNCIERDPSNPATTWYVGTDVGVFATSNGGGTWQNATIPLGLPSVQVTSIMATAYKSLNVSTYGRGMWLLGLNSGQGFGQAPNSVAAIEGNFVPGPPHPVNGIIQELTKDDGVLVNMASVFDKGVNYNIAAWEGDYALPPGTLTGATVSVTSAVNANATEQIFLFNYTTKAFDLVKTYPSTSTLTNTIVQVTKNVSAYMDGGGHMRVAIRALVPGRLGAAFTLEVDSMLLSASTN